ncbi:MAG: redoxin domain-containing protein [Deltaproteobacteria bacterium]|nr:redoxin domain-containing protein [Deltaproteobacteria bacterium]MBW2382566.1 redoxin domain-containing protein [Deltaproteobacteria bacterium]MBW2697223.1 redoxin domain-containing protein [Deltaproteobacteria bacterium]
MRRWEDLRPELDARGIGIVTISGDTPTQIAKGRSKHGARATMLSDPDLEVAARYNLINDRNLKPGGLGPLHIPTTFLVDAQGIVRWIDQAEDYQIRSHPDRVLDAIRSGLATA